MDHQGQTSEHQRCPPTYAVLTVPRPCPVRTVLQYYKGLGTSTAQEAKEYFSDLGTHRINFIWTVSRPP